MLLGMPLGALSGSDGQSLYVPVGSSTPCQTYTYDVKEYWETHYRDGANALVNSNKGSLKVVPGVYPGNAAPYVLGYFGMLCDEPVSTGVTHVLHDEGRTHSKSHRKDFIRDRNAGKIVLNPMRAYKCEVTASQKPVSPTLISVNSYPMSYPVPFPQGETGCPYHSPQLLDQKSGRYLWSQPESTVWYNWYVVNGFEAPAADLLKGYAIALADVVDKMDPDTQLVTECRARANEGILDLYTSLAESPQTVGMIYSILKTVIRGWKRTNAEQARIIRKYAGNPRLLTDKLSELWLGYRYGIMPLYYDVRGLLEYLGISRSEYLTVRSSSKQMTDCTLVGLDSFKFEVEERCFIKNRLDLESTKMDQFLRQDLTVTAWELVPLSFVIDWFVTVGDFLASLRSPQASVQEAAMYSWRVRAPVIASYTGGLGSVELRPDYYRATPINPSDHTGLTLTFGMNFQRTLDALALSWVLFLKANRR